MNYSIEIVTPPTKEPVEQSDVRRHIKASSQTDNAEITLIMQAAREYVESHTGRIFINTEFKMYLDSWGIGGSSMPWWDGVREGAMTEYSSGYIELPYGPLQSITHIKTYDTLGVAALWPTTSYMIDRRRQDIGRFSLSAGNSWPAVGRASNGIEIQFIVGYGDEPKQVPALAKLAIMMQCAHLYQHRGDESAEEASKGVLDLINQLKIKRLGLI